MYELELTDLGKTFKNKKAVQDINIRLGHSIYGLLGENGAGKTTLMRMLCGILTPTRGKFCATVYLSDRWAVSTADCLDIFRRISAITAILTHSAF